MYVLVIDDEDLIIEKFVRTHNMRVIINFIWKHVENIGKLFERFFDRWIFSTSFLKKETEITMAW